MIWNDYSKLNLGHSFMSPSQNSWLRYEPAKLIQVYENNKRKEEGTQLHNLASELIVRKIKVAPLKKAFNRFVNDCIGFDMASEKMLFYSFNCYGTADAIKYIKEDNHLMVFDLKTGVSPVKFTQLDVYAAIFCLEYKVNPKKLTITQRIYQGAGFEEQIQEGEYIQEIMDKIVNFNELLEEHKNNF